jgi:MoaA/NifB/PqqE/SkfB family radical SAM enzyme
MNQIKKNGISRSKQFLYYTKWFLGQKLGNRKPLVNTMILHLACNLTCEHCDIANQRNQTVDAISLSYITVKEKMENLYQRGARIAYFEGGEPTLWKDGDKNLSDLIRLAKEIGYFTTGYTTNGTGTFFLDSDVISISLDGPKEVHDKIRSSGTYQLLMKNLEKINHPAIFANMTITKSNLNYIAETVQLVEKNPKIKGIMLNFITPPPESLQIKPEEKNKAIQLILALKNQNAPILNTRLALQKLMQSDFTNQCPLWMSAFILPDGTELFGCPLRSEISCQQCGFNAVREYALIAQGHFSVLWEMSKHFAFSGEKKQKSR